MANDQHQERLEDQLRRMIISNGQPRAPHDQVFAQQRPIVNLPPANGHQARQYQPHIVQHHATSSNDQTRFVNAHRYQQPDPRSYQPNLAQPQAHEFAGRTQQNWRHHDYNRSNQAMPYARVPRPLYDPAHQESNRRRYQQLRAQHLDQLLQQELPLVDMTEDEQLEKHAFRSKLEHICQEICTIESDTLPRIELKCFGSLESGFATANSDMDLVIVVADGRQSTDQFSLLDNDLPRLLEKKLLQIGYGARLLTRTRVPIIKVCELPTPPLLSRLRAERDKWDMRDTTREDSLAEPDEEDIDETLHVATEVSIVEEDDRPDTQPLSEVESMPVEHVNLAEASQLNSSDTTTQNLAVDSAVTNVGSGRSRKAWLRERDAGPLDFPKTGVGIQCDINFFNPLGLHNTQLLRCYSRCDPRVRHMVIFVKAWAKRRKINSAYAGTLSSYGYVLMVLHYLMNVAMPPVLPNLQHAWRPDKAYTPHGAGRVEIDEWIVDFWRNENEILHAAQSGLLTRNTESVGSLLAGFFSYYAAVGERPFFHWTQNVLSLRTHGGIMSKEEKGWVKARTEEGDGKKVQYRYLFCIEDPFELSHNVARTVTHNGIVAVRDEFRRAARILLAVGNQAIPSDGQLFDQVLDDEPAAPPKTRRFSHKATPKELQTQQPQRRVDVSNKDAFPDLKAAPTSSQKKQTPKQNKPVQSKPKGESKQTKTSADTPQDEIPAEDATSKKPSRGRRRPRRVPLQMDAA